MGVGVGLGVGFGVGFGVGLGVARTTGFGLAVGFGAGLAVGLGVGLAVGLGADPPHLSANRTVHIFLPSGPWYAPTPMTSQARPRMFFRWPEESMNILWMAAVAVSSGYVFQPMFSPASL